MQALTKPDGANGADGANGGDGSGFGDGGGGATEAAAAAVAAAVASAGPVRSRALLQVAGAVVEALQRTSSKTKPPSSWERMGEVEVAHAKLAEVGGDGEALLSHLMAQLQSPAMGQASLGLVEVMQLLVHAASLGVAWVPDSPAAVQVRCEPTPSP